MESNQSRLIFRSEIFSIPDFFTLECILKRKINSSLTVPCHAFLELPTVEPKNSTWFLHIKDDGGWGKPQQFSCLMYFEDKNGFGFVTVDRKSFPLSPLSHLLADFKSVFFALRHNNSHQKGRKTCIESNPGKSKILRSPHDSNLSTKKRQSHHRSRCKNALKLKSTLKYPVPSADWLICMISWPIIAERFAYQYTKHTMRAKFLAVKMSCQTQSDGSNTWKTHSPTALSRLAYLSLSIMALILLSAIILLLVEMCHNKATQLQDAQLESHQNILLSSTDCALFSGFMHFSLMRNRAHSIQFQWAIFFCVCSRFARFN